MFPAGVYRDQPGVRQYQRDRHVPRVAMDTSTAGRLLPEDVGCAATR